MWAIDAGQLRGDFSNSLRRQVVTGLSWSSITSQADRPTRSVEPMSSLAEMSLRFDSLRKVSTSAFLIEYRSS
jgi:hypothetical protein